MYCITSCLTLDAQIIIDELFILGPVMGELDIAGISALIGHFILLYNAT